jgi:hypothetical protein
MAKKKKKKKVVPADVRLRRAGKKAHKALSIYIRTIFTAKYGKCPLCNERPIQALFHILRSRYVAILRYDERNVIASCHKCNWLEYRNPDPSRAWYIREYGTEQYLQICDEGKNKWEYTEEDYHKIENRFTALLAAWKSIQDAPPEPVRPPMPPDVPLNPDSMNGAGDEFGGEDFPS